MSAIDPQSHFDNLLLQYNNLIKYADGHGHFSQSLMDHTLARITAFAQEHPTFKSQIPQKHIARDDLPPPPRIVFTEKQKDPASFRRVDSPDGESTSS